ncbi:universal stress protein [Limnochorda pilosa]|uniref:Universal stress protein UspA n=1 Tax=Limnochorda pilosa TaxID=1555112 RepID=A0A0K2SIP8_LIMPI|nr:universal stress protein [Limnochorda pilosa]BAS26694.1 universal stress protein UspA [Limnochorda pilosa]
MTSIVVGIDGSDHARAALGWAVELARAVPDPVVHLVNAAWVTAQAFEWDADAYRRYMDQAGARGGSLLEEAAAPLSGAGVRVEPHVLAEPPAAALLQVAEETGAELIATGRRGLGRAASALLGSVSADVVHRAHVPVLVARDGGPRTLRRVLVGVDGSQHSARALAFAARWAPQAQITALHVLHVAPEARTLFEHEGLSLDVAMEQTAEETVRRTAEAARLDPARVMARAASGSAADELFLAYRDGGYDLAVVGSRGLGTLGELFLGSVSERLLRVAAGPVVVVK